MTKLQLLHRALNERLMAAVEQIMEMVGGTVLEYEQETVRARRENEILRRRLRWMEGENPTDWPDPTAFSVPGEASLTDTLALESLIIKTEPIDSSDFQLCEPDASLPASVCTTNMEMIYPGTSAPADAGIPDGMLWDSAQSYMAPLDFDPTLSTMARNRNQRRSFACPDCGKVFGREQRLMFHMRIHSAERPYTYRRRKTCFYGDKKRKKKLRGLSKISREFIEDLSDTSEQTEQSTGSANVGMSTNAGSTAPDVEPSEASDEASEHTSCSKLSETSAARPVGLKAKQGREKAKTAQCLQCNKAFTNLSRLAVHMKTHSKPLPGQDEQNAQGDTDRTLNGSQHLPKVIRNNETEVEKAKAIGQRLFQCPECKKIFARSCWLNFHLKSHERERKRQKKAQLQNNNLKDVPQVSEEPKKEVSTESSKVHVLKKIFACPYCDKVFAREGWLGPHIRSHTIKKQNSDIASDTILPDSTKRRTRRVVAQACNTFQKKLGQGQLSASNEPSTEGGSEQKKITEQALGETENSETVNEQPKTETSASPNIPLELTNPESEIIISNNPEEIRNESESISNKTETTANKIAEEFAPVSVDSSGQKGGVKKAKKRFPCRECGKVYLLAGWLKTHRKMHKNERILEEKRRQLMMMKEFEQNDNKEEGQSLVETSIIQNKQKKKKKSLGLQESLDNKKKKKNQLTNAVLLKAMENSSDVQTAADKSKQSDGSTRGQCVCKDCGKVYARKNWLSLHMLGHRKALMALPQKANDEAQKSDGQATKEGSSTQDSKGQKGKDGGKASFPCPFCNKVFPRAMRLMVHMQIHSGEKPYSYRQRKEQFYADPTRPRVPDTDKPEPAVEGNDEKGKDGGNEVTRSQTSTVSQDHASTTEPMETIQPQSICTDRKFTLLPLQSSGAATIHSTTLTRTDSKSDSNFSLQPRIVLDQVIAESSHSPSSEGGDCKPVIMETSDIQLHQTPDLETNDAATGGQVKSHHAQTPLENSIPYASQNTLAETDRPDIVCDNVGSVHKHHENTSCSEKLLVSTGDQQTSKSPEPRKSEICKSKGQVESQEYSLLDVKQHKVQCDPELQEMDIESEQSESQIHTHGKSRFLDIVKAKNVPPEHLKHGSDKMSIDTALTTVPELSPTESSSSAIHQVSHTKSGYMIFSDVSDDDEWANVSGNPDEKKEKPTLKISTPIPEGLADAGSSPHKASDSHSDVALMLEKTGEQNSLDGTLANKDEMADTSVQQTEEPSSTGQKRCFTCLSCGLTFGGEAFLTQHMKVHSVSAGTYQKSNTFKTLKKRVKNSETKIKQEVQTSEVGSADSTDNSEISGKSDSTLINVNTAKLFGSCPDTGAAIQSSRADSETVDRKSKTEHRTLHCCCYCGKACEKIELHLMHDHPQEPKVIEALHFRNTLEERKRLLSLLCSSKKLKRDCTTRRKKDEDHVHCIICQGYYQRNQFWKHALICEQKQPKELNVTAPGSSTDHPSTSLRSRPSIAQQNFDPESGNLIKDIFCNTVQQAIPESVNLPSPKAEQHTTRYLYSISPVSETGNTEIKPIPSHGSNSLSIFYSGNSSGMMNLDSESSGPLIQDSLNSALEYTSTSVQESCSSTVEEALVENQELTCPPLRTKDISGKELQSTLEPESKLGKILQPHTTVSSSSYLLDTGSGNLQPNPDQDCAPLALIKNSSKQPLDCSGTHVIPQESVSHIHTGSSDSQPTTNLKLDWTTIPTAVSVDLEQNLDSDTEPERTTVMMPELKSERTAKSSLHSETTNCIVANIFSSDANPETGNISIQVFGNDDDHRAPDLGSHCHPIPNHIPSEKQQTTDPETYSATKNQFDSEGHIRDDTEEGGQCTGQNNDLKPLDLNSTTAVRRRQDSRSRNTERRRQSDPLQQTSTEEGNASPVTSQTPEMKHGLQISDIWKSLKNRKGTDKLKLKKKHFCLYCKKTSFRMAQHLLSAHAKEPEVAKALSYDKKSKERKQLLDLLQSKGNLLHKDMGMSLPASEQLLPTNQASSFISNQSRPSEQENPNPESVSRPVSDTHHSVAQLDADTQSPCEDLGLVREELLADFESQSDLTPDTSLVTFQTRKDRVHKIPTCSSPTCDQTETSKSEDEKTDAEQSIQKGLTMENRRRSSRIQARPRRVKDNPSNEVESMSPRLKLHVCQHCSATFCSRYHLRRHEYTHTDERPYWCMQCNIGFIQKYRYRNHRMTHHGESQSSKYQDSSRKYKKQSLSGDKPAENELYQEQLDNSTAATAEPSSNAEGRPDLTGEDTGSLGKFHTE